MIKYALKCASGHRFEAWFRSSAVCDEQIAAGAVACPVCGDARVAKALMAPQVATGRARDESASPPPAPADRGPPRPGGAREPDPDPAARPAPDRPAPEPSMTAAPTAAALRAAVEHRLRALRAHVEANAEHVGEGFIERARRMHEGEEETRPIYGEADLEEARALAEDGAQIAPLPWIDRKRDQ